MQSFVTISLICGISALLIITGVKNQPGIGVIGALIAIAITLWLRGDKFSTLGLNAPSDWWGIIWRGFLYGLGLYLVSTLLIDPLSEVITGNPHDYSNLKAIRGNLLATIQILVAVWIFVAMVEEFIYRGFLMTEIAKITGNTTVAMVFIVLITSIVFGLSHGYQGTSGMISTGIIGALFAGIFVLSKFSLWEAVIAHGVLDTIAIIMIATNRDIFIRQNILSIFWNLPG